MPGWNKGSLSCLSVNKRPQLRERRLLPYPFPQKAKGWVNPAFYPLESTLKANMPFISQFPKQIFILPLAGWLPFCFSHIPGTSRTKGTWGKNTFPNSTCIINLKIKPVAVMPHLKITLKCTMNDTGR